MTFDRSSKATQATLCEAEAILAAAIEGQSREESPRLQLLYAHITAVRAYSASSNSIPGLSGLGLDEAMELAQDIISLDKITERTVQIQSYRYIGSAFSIKE